MSSDQQTLELQPAAPRPRTFALGAATHPERQVAEYADRLTQTAREHGEASARRSDPGLHDALLLAIRRRVMRGDPFGANEIRSDVPGASGNAIGAAFSGAAKAGLIRRVGYGRSTAPSRHGGVQSIWSSAGGP